MASVLDKFSLAGKTALVTGGAGLLGCQFTRALGEAGANVAVADLNLTAAQAQADQLTQERISAIPVGVDVADPESVTKMVQTVLDAFGGLDVLVNAAALDPKFDPDHMEEQNANAFEYYALNAWLQTMNVNLTGVFLTCQAAVKPMLEQGAGVIVNISSIYGLAGPDQRIYPEVDGKPRFKPVDYAVTKAGILGLTRYLAAYYAGTKIRVNALSPGGVYNQHDDNFVEKYTPKVMLGRMADLNELDSALVFLVSDASSYMTGANLVVDGGYTAW